MLPSVAAGVAAQRVIPWDLDENQRDPVGIGHVHLAQAPWFAARLAGDRNAPAPQLGLSRRDVADLEPQRTGEGSAG